MTCRIVSTTAIAAVAIALCIPVCASAQDKAPERPPEANKARRREAPPEDDRPRLDPPRPEAAMCPKAMSGGRGGFRGRQLPPASAVECGMPGGGIEWNGRIRRWRLRHARRLRLLHSAIPNGDWSGDSRWSSQTMS
jgi:hypothetical protein